MRKFLVRALLPSPSMVMGGVAFVASLARPGNADLIWHLAVGRVIVAGRSPADISALYYTPSAGGGCDYSWLSQALLYAAHQLLGPAGLAVLSALVGGLVFYMMHRVLEKGSGNLLVNAAVLSVVFCTVAGYLGGRPAMFTVLFFALETCLLLEYQAERRNLLWLIPATTVLWVNLHPGFLVAPVAVAVFLVFAPNRRQRMALFGCLGATLTAVVVNPYTWRMYLLPYELCRSLAMLRGLTEWVGIGGLLVLFWGALAALAAFGFGRHRPSWPVLIMFLLTGLASAAMSRNLPLFGVAAIPAIAAGVPTYLPTLERWKPLRRFNVSYPGAGGWFWVLAVPVAIILLARVPGSGVRFGMDLRGYPVAAIGELKHHSRPEHIFVREPWSGYLLWEMPEQKLFFDAKGAFNPEVMKDHLELIKPGPRWREVADKYEIQTLLLEHDSPLAVVLNEATGWVRVWDDTVAAVYVREGRLPE